MRTILLLLATCLAALGQPSLWLLPGPNTDLISQIIPAWRYTSWLPGVSNGVPNPSYPVGINITNDPYNAVGDGVTDNTAAFSNAVAACPAFNCVFVPAGTYVVSNQITINRPIGIRGVGIQSDSGTYTKIVGYDTNYPAHRAIFYFGGSGYSGSNLVTAGYAVGTRSLTLATTNGLTAGKFIMVQQQNDPAVVLGAVPNFATGRYQGQMGQVASISGNVITLTRPLYQALNPTYVPYVVSFNDPFPSNSFVENLTVEMKGTMPENIWFASAADSWCTNVESTNVSNATGGGIHIALAFCLRCEVRECYAHGCWDRNQGYNNVYGIDAASYATDCLICDNVLDQLYEGVILQNAASGNVVSYNYFWRGFGIDYPNDSSIKNAFMCHGGNANFNLFEGNIGSLITSDDFWGVNWANTYFRNWATRYSLNGSGNPIPNNKIACLVAATNRDINVVGNILCAPRDIEDSNTNDLVWDIGRNNNQTNHDEALDPVVPTNCLRAGNFEFVGQTLQWPNNVSITTNGPYTAATNLPASMYLTSKPSWFGTNNWPPIGPDNQASNGLPMAMKCSIPALQRYMGWYGRNFGGP